MLPNPCRWTASQWAASLESTLIYKSCHLAFDGRRRIACRRPRLLAELSRRDVRQISIFSASRSTTQSRSQKEWTSRTHRAERLCSAQAPVRPIDASEQYSAVRCNLGTSDRPIETDSADRLGKFNSGDRPVSSHAQKKGSGAVLALFAGILSTASNPRTI